jgi:hypothetical protein
MMSRLGGAAILIACLITGCSKPATYQSYSDEKTNSPISKPPPGERAPASASPPSAPMLAYAYSYQIEAPPRALPILLGRQEGACVAAGPSICQVVASDLERRGRDTITASLSMRASPSWLAGFRNGLAKEATGVGGRITQANATSEDLSRQVVDTQAEIRAKTALRDRLQSILDNRPAKVSDLLEVETNLANVQADLDKTQSEMAMMRQRLDSSAITINYASAAGLGSDGAWAPVASAFSRFTSIIAQTLGVMITVIAVLAPWALVVGVGAWIVMGLMKSRLGRKRPPAAQKDE